MAATLFDKIWDPHVIADLGSGWSLLHCDRVLLLYGVWTAVLGRERATALDHVLIFNAVNWWAVVRRVFGIEVCIRDFFVQVQTIAQCL